MTSCEIIREFLDWTDTCEQDCAAAEALKNKASAEIEDILKKMQFDPPGYRGRAKLATELSALLAAKQKAADAEAILSEACLWISSHHAALKGLRYRLERMDKLAEKSKSASYVLDTDVVQQILEGG